MSKALAIILFAALTFASTHADARRKGDVYGFRTGSCKSTNCYRKHPSGRYVHPLTRQTRHY